MFEVPPDFLLCAPCCLSRRAPFVATVPTFGDRAWLCVKCSTPACCSTCGEPSESLTQTDTDANGAPVLACPRHLEAEIARAVDLALAADHELQISAAMGQS